MIKGLFGCNCHPFESWEECSKMHRQKFTLYDTVLNRCSKLKGIIIHFYKDDKSYVGVKYESNDCVRIQEHVCMLIKLEVNEKAK